MRAIISAKDITYQVEHKKVLSNITITVHAGESFALIGKNGAGKTTLFEIILKDITPTSGTVSFDPDIGHDFKHTGIVYDHLPLFPLLKVKEIIDYFFSLYGIAPSKVPTKYFEVFGLNDLSDSFIQSLSQGERKKVGLFLSIIHNPQLLILDEPFSNIDPTVIDGIWQVLRKNNRTILFTTHNWKEVEEVATTIAFIHKGEIIGEPTSTEAIIRSLPHAKKIVTNYHQDLVSNIEGFEFYIHEDRLHIFNDGSPDLIETVSQQTNNFSFKECDIKDAYLLSIKDNE